MKKYFYLILAILGIALVGYSVMNGWATFYMKFADAKSDPPIMGYEFMLGILTGVFGAVSIGVLFIKPKIAIVPALLAIGCAAYFYMKPPMIEEIQYDPEKMVIAAMVGGLFLALAGLVAPKKA